MNPVRGLVGLLLLTPFLFAFAPTSTAFSCSGAPLGDPTTGSLDPGRDRWYRHDSPAPGAPHGVVLQLVAAGSGVEAWPFAVDEQGGCDQIASCAPFPLISSSGTVSVFACPVPAGSYVVRVHAAPIGLLPSASARFVLQAFSADSIGDVHDPDSLVPRDTHSESDGQPNEHPFQ